MRITFSIFNFIIPSITLSTWLNILLHGLHLDFAAIFYINIPLLIIYFFVTPLLPKNYKTSSTLYIYLALNLPFIAINFIDIIYYRYNHRRSTKDFFYALSESTHSFTSLFFQYWWMLLIFILLSFALYFISAQTIKPVKTLPPVQLVHQIIAFIVYFACAGMIARGNSSRPISPSSALLYVSPEWQPLVNNSTLNILYSTYRQQSHLKHKNYLTINACDSIVPVIKQYQQNDSFSKKSIVMFVLESFSEHNLTQGKLRAITPFFDSLRSKSTVIKYTFQNGYESIQGLPALLISTPPFLDEPLYMSNYSNILYKGIGAILKNEGYSTNFFLGAEYDHFNFAKLCKMIGIEHYYSKDIFNDKTKDDKTWGIYDEYFFPFFAKISDTIQKPFFNVLYNISSHPPFNIPANRKQEFANSSDQLNAISYVDMCFKKLFEEINSKEWFKNTLFVFIADHTLISNPLSKPWQHYKSLQIPFFIYDPSEPEGQVVTTVCQQLDLVPTILDKLRYSKPFTSFGNSIFRNNEKFSISLLNGTYQLIDSATITGFDDQSNRLLYYYNWRTDPNLTINDTTNSSAQRSITLIKAVVQQFNNGLINNSFQNK